MTLWVLLGSIDENFIKNLSKPAMSLHKGHHTAHTIKFVVSKMYLRQ